MGLLLLFMAVGSLLALPLSGMVVQRLGASKAVTVFAVANVVGLVTAVAGVATGRTSSCASGCSSRGSARACGTRR